MDDVSAHRFPVRSGFDHKKKSGRREFVRAKLTVGEDGAPMVLKHGASGAGILSSLAEADGLVDLEADLTYLKSGSSVDFLPFNEVLT
jgi:molybdopterin molybdotransferase